jgi:hypothetical protein
MCMPDQEGLLWQGPKRNVVGGIFAAKFFDEPGDERAYAVTRCSPIQSCRPMLNNVGRKKQVAGLDLVLVNPLTCKRTLDNLLHSPTCSKMEAWQRRRVRWGVSRNASRYHRYILLKTYHACFI